jgi:1H-pyrrole-2-carbonyl-[peptidyl-carrier protein] brominase
MKTQVVIIGGGPAGSACAIHLAMRGIHPVIVERERFPRFHIGESLTGGSGDLLREMGLEKTMKSMNFPVKYGIRGRGPVGALSFWVPIKTRDADSDEQRETFSWQVRRSTFDHMLLTRAVELGATLLQGDATRPIFDEQGRARGVEVTPDDGPPVRVDCEVLVDATGQRTFLANQGVTGPKHHGRYARQVAIFSHFTGAVRDQPQWGNILTYFKKQHYWSWFIPIDEETTSIGFVVPGDYYRSKRESLQDFVTRELREFNPELAERVTDVEQVEEVRAISNYSYHVDDYTGDGWLCIGDAHRFVDPLFSFGVNIGMAEGRESARAIAAHLGNGRSHQPFQQFAQWADQGLDRAQLMLDGFWQATFHFGLLLRQHEPDFVDLFAGRLWPDEEYLAVEAMRARLAEPPAETLAETATA